MSVARGFAEEIQTARLWNNVIASLFRVSLGFYIATLLGVPLGLWLGRSRRACGLLLPTVNFFRGLSPLAWVPFAILWLGIGDRAVIFLIFMSTFFTLVLATVAAVASIPSIYFRVAEDYEIDGIKLLAKVILPATLPQVISAIRLTAGVAWLVVVAAEMVSGRDGLGFAIWDARNGLRIDLIITNMMVIGVIGVLLDRLLTRLTRIPGVRWAYER
jgi:NitT/TauT family transport system permease protein